MRRSFSFILNTGLVLVLVGMLTAPIIFQWALTDITTSNGEVAGVQSKLDDFVVLPNFFDFGKHVSFNPSQNGEIYKDVLELTVFSGQKATYHTLYTVFNKTNESITLELVSGVVESSGPFDSIVLSMMPAGYEHMTNLTQSAVEGDVVLLVDESDMVQITESVVVGTVSIPVLVYDAGSIITNPLTAAFEADTPVYPGAILSKGSSAIRSRTDLVQVAPGESAVINAVVSGAVQADGGTVKIPLYLRRV